MILCRKSLKENLLIIYFVRVDAFAPCIQIMQGTKIDDSFLLLIKSFPKGWWWKGFLEIYAQHNEKDFTVDFHTHQSTWHLIMARRLKLILRVWRMTTTKEIIACKKFFANTLCRQLFFYLKEVLLLSSCQTLIKGLCIVCFMFWT